MTTPVNFELALLLKGKGFGNSIHYDGVGGYFTTTTIAEVVMWIHKTYGIWIEVHHIQTYGVNRFHVIIWDYKNLKDYYTIHCDKGRGPGYEVWDTPDEAYEAAIVYCLNKLI